MPIKYKTKLIKTSANKLKQDLWELITQCDEPRTTGQSGESQFVIYHAIKLVKTSDKISVKIYEKLSGEKERVAELDNLFILHLLVKSVIEEIEVTTSK